MSAKKQIDPATEFQEFEHSDDTPVFDALRPGTKLLTGNYTIRKFINSGGFGITYLASDSLDRDIVIKECFPGSFCRRSEALVAARSRAHKGEFSSLVALFIQEARSLSKLEHRNIVGVHQVWEENDTAYMAIDYIRGPDLLEVIADTDNQITPARLFKWTVKLLDALAFIHDHDVLHRDISPDNVLINDDDEPILIDFGAAREEATRSNRALSALRVVKEGYSPQEFYVSGGSQGPSSDLYALGATFYHVLVGEAPPNSQTRIAALADSDGDGDPYVPLEGRVAGYPPEFLRAIDTALKVMPRDRLQTAHDWLAMIQETAPLTVVEPAKSTPAAQPTPGATQPASSKTPLVVGLLLGLAAVGGGAYFMMQGGTEPGPVTQPDVAGLSTPEPGAGTDPGTQAPATAAQPDPGPAPDAGGFAIKAEWSVEVPFESEPHQSPEGTFASVTLVRADLIGPTRNWLKSGTIVFSIAGKLTFDQESVRHAILSAPDLGNSNLVRLPALVRLPGADESSSHMLVVPVTRIIELPDGTIATARTVGQAWRTTVTDVPEGSSSDLREGDILVSEALSGKSINAPRALEEALTELANKGDQAAELTVSRGGTLLPVRIDIKEGE